jgi:hypothetical protein
LIGARVVLSSRVAACIASSVLAASCASPPPIPPARAGAMPSLFLSDPRPERYHSARFELSLPLPDGHGWKIDDHHGPMLVATHEATAARLTVAITTEADLMNRQRCEAVARERGLVRDADFQTVADEVIVGPSLFDSHVTVAALPSTVPHRSTSGHVFLFGARVHKCLFLHYETNELVGDDAAALSSRLAVARLQIVDGIRVESFDSPDTMRRR